MDNCCKTKTAQACQDSLLTERAVDDDVNATVQTNCGHKQNNKLLVISHLLVLLQLLWDRPKKGGAGGTEEKGKKNGISVSEGNSVGCAVGPSVNLLAN